MGRLINVAGVYGLLALVAGLVFRETTKLTDFTGQTDLAFAHTHFMTMGMFLFLILALYAKSTDVVQNARFKKFFMIYNIAFPTMMAAMLVKGFMQIFNPEASSAMWSSIAGVAGLGHIGVTAAFVYLYLALKQTAAKENSQ